MKGFGWAFLMIAACAGCAIRPQAEWLGDADEVRSVAGWPELDSEHARATSEIRVWLDHGLVVPHHALRITHTENAVSAEIARWWPNDPDLRRSADRSSGRTFAERQIDGCPNLRRGKAVDVCVIRLPDAAAGQLLSELTALDIWQLREPFVPDGLIVVTADGETLSVELRQRGDYRHIDFALNKRDSRFDATAKLIADRVSHVVASYDSP